MIDATGLPECVERAPRGAASASILWLHGLGADGHDFEPLVDELALPEDTGVRFVFPHAPYRPVSLNAGARMRAWYDLLPPGPGWREDEAGIAAAADTVRELIEREARRGVPPRQLVLGGFSQGGAVALYAGLRHPERLAGIVALSTYLPLAGHLPEEAAAANRDVPILLAHGSADPLIGRDIAERSRDRLRSLGYPVQWRLYDMAHSICPEEIHDLRAWLIRVALAAPGAA